MKWMFVLLIVGAVGFFLLRSYGVLSGSDTQCSQSHTASTPQPQNPATAKDFFDLGNYYYDSGKCDQAVIAYGSAIGIDGTVPQYFNNRAYTYMRLRDYKDALDDLNKAIELNPNYVQALMNRGDIHNYYYQIDRKSAIVDYQKVIALGATSNTSVCGHIAMAKTNNLLPLAILDMFLITKTSCK